MPDGRLLFMSRKHLLQGESGVSLVEFALILPLFLLLLLGMVDLGQGLNAYLGMLNATREGAIWLARHPDDLTGMTARIAHELAYVGLTTETVAITRSPAKATYIAGDLVTITLDHNQSLLFGTVTGMDAISLQTEQTIRIP